MILIYTSKSRWPIIIFILVFLIIVVTMTYGYIIYHNLMQQKESGYDTSTKHVLDETSIVAIDEKYKYYGKNNYHIFLGLTEDEEEKWVFFPLDDDKDITLLDMNETISQDELEQQWKNECQSCTLMKVSPAMDDGEPLWEMTYKDGEKRLNIDYFSMEDGADHEQFRFKKMFK